MNQLSGVLFRIQMRMEQIVQVCPTAEELGRDIQVDVKCTECSKLFSHNAALNMHQVKVHKIIKDEKDLNLLKGKRNGCGKIKMHYHCPIDACIYNNSKAQKHFKNLANLRQHFLKVHSERKYMCLKCESTFSMDRLRRQHQLKCNPVFVCAQCPERFTDRITLFNHCQITQHPYLFTRTPLSTPAAEDSLVGGQSILQDHNYWKTDSDHSHTSSLSNITESCTKEVVRDKHNTAAYLNTSLNTTVHSEKACEVTNGKDTSCEVDAGGRMEECETFNCTIEQYSTVNNKNDNNINKGQSDIFKIVDRKNAESFAKDSTHQSHTIEEKAINKPLKKGDRFTKKCLPKLLPKDKPVAMVLPVSVINQHFFVMPNQHCMQHPKRVLLPKPPSNHVNCNNAGNHTSEITQMANIPEHSFLDILKNPNTTSLSTRKASVKDSWRERKIEAKGRKRQRLSSATQTGGTTPKRRLRKAVETQTTGDYILKKAMRSAKLPVIKESRGSQVSPRAKLKRAFQQQMSCETQTSGSNGPSMCHRKRRRKSVVKCDFSVNTGVDELARPQCPVGGPQISAQSHSNINTCVETSSLHANVTPLVPASRFDYDRRLLVESISTQTSDSYLSEREEVSELSQVQSVEIQTKLSMNMSLDACDTRDIQSLEQVGFVTSQVSAQNRGTVSTNTDKGQFESSLSKHENQLDDSTSRFLQEMCSIPHTIPVLNSNRNHSEAITQAENAIQTKITELEQGDRAETDFSHNPMFSLLNPTVNQGHSTNLEGTCGVSVQTERSSLPLLLSAEVQTVNNLSVDAINSIETQTTNDDIISEFLNHMETQTNNELWAELGLNDIQTQTNEELWMELGLSDSETQTTGLLERSVNVETQTVGRQGTGGESVQTQASLLDVCLTDEAVDSADIQTQTLFELTDSHTQTSWNDLMKIMNEVHNS